MLCFVKTYLKILKYKIYKKYIKYKIFYQLLTKLKFCLLMCLLIGFLITVCYIYYSLQYYTNQTNIAVRSVALY